ncbi:MAG: ATP-binding cassette domain-containing protein [Polyangiales bacterium]
MTLASLDGSHVRLHGVGMQFGSTQVLRAIDLDVRRGQIVVILGGSGSGKTTLLRIIMGLVQPTRGAVVIEGQDITRMTAKQLHRAREKWSMVFQYSALLDSLTVFDNIALPLLEHESLSGSQRKQRVQALLGSLELAGTEKRYPSELSGGMRKRVALARALVRRPSLIVYDEPASGLDPLTARMVDDLILRTRDSYGVTSIVISHDMAQAAKLADYVFVLDKGDVAARGTLNELRSRPDCLAAKFFEASRIDAPDAIPALGQPRAPTR